MQANTDSFDVFVSYAHVDNEPTLPDAAGWITTFVNGLKSETNRKVGRPVVRFWWDTSDMRRAHDFEMQINEALGRAQMIVTVLSEGYFSSDWCMEEQQIFCRTHGADIEGRVLVAELSPVEPERREQLAFRNRTPVPFWVLDDGNRARRMADPVPLREERDYFHRIQDLAHEIAQCYRLVQSRSEATPVPVAPAQAPPPPQADAPLVVIAETTEDLEPRRESLVRRLKDAGVSHIALDSYGLSTSQFTASVDAALKSAGHFVQLLGPSPGRARPEAPQGHPRLQLERAKLAAPAVRLLQWRDPALDPAAIEDTDYRAILLGEAVQAVSFDRFRDLALEQLRPVAAPQVEIADGPFVMVNYDAVDQPEFEEIRQQIPAGIASVGPPETGADNYRVKLEKRILDCNRMMVVFGQAEPDWVQAQLQRLSQLALKRETAFQDLVVLRRPPTDRPVPEVRIKGLRVVDWLPGKSLAEAGVSFT